MAGGKRAIIRVRRRSGLCQREKRRRSHVSRQEFTRMKIFLALEKLVLHQDIETIRVSDLCRACGISRSTFYLHFEDIFSVVCWYWDDICARTLNRINVNLTWEEGHLKMLQALLERRPFFTRSFAKKDYRSLFVYGYRTTLEVHVRNIQLKLGRDLTPQERFELDYIVRALSAMTTKWAEEGMRQPPEDMAALFSRFVPPFARCM